MSKERLGLRHSPDGTIGRSKKLSTPSLEQKNLPPSPAEQVAIPETTVQALDDLDQTLSDAIDVLHQAIQNLLANSGSQSEV